MNSNKFPCILLLVVLLASSQSAAITFGAFDPEFWNGLVIIKDNQVFAFRLAIHKDQQVVDGYDTFYLVERVGPNAPDGSYAEVSFNPQLPFNQGDKTQILQKTTPLSDLVRLRYAGFQDGILGCVNFPENISIEVIFYSPWDKKIGFQSHGKFIIAKRGDTEFLFSPLTFPLKNLTTNEHKMSGMVESNHNPFYFYAGFDPEKMNDVVIEDIEDIFAKQKAKYQSIRPVVTGEWRALISSISNNLFWMKLYQPDFKRIYLPAGRRWIFPKPDGTRDIWTIFEWDAFFNALEASIEDPCLAKSEIEAVLSTQYPWGNIPNWRSAYNGSSDRSQPPVGSFAVLKIYNRTGDLSILSVSYNRLKKWHEFWTAPGSSGTPRRDGNSDGLLEWGSDREKLFPGMPDWEKGQTGRQRAAWESGQDDLPNFDGVPFDETANTLTMNCLDLSSLYALDCECMAAIATLMGKTQDAEEFRKKYETIRKKVAKDLWNKDFFYDRFWEGTFSEQKAASNFYPLIAGIPDEKQVEKMVGHILSEEEFWGDHVLPTISRDNPAFKDQQYWRGTIWPPTNYLVYQGLKRYKRDLIAAKFARKSASLFLKSWETVGLCRENYHSVSGEGGGQRYQSWGPLFALILLEDFIDVCPFDGFRVGNLAASANSQIKNIRIMGCQYGLDIDENSLSLSRDSVKILSFTGNAVLRQLVINTESISFDAHVMGKAIHFYPQVFSGKSYRVKSVGNKARKREYYVQIPRGHSRVLLEVIE